MSVYRASIEDVQAILSLINNSNSEAFRRIIPSEFFKQPILTSEELLREMDQMTFYFCKVEECIVGVAALRVESDEAGQISWVYVLPSYQGKGVGTALMRHIEDEAGRIKLKKLRLFANEKAYWARNFYKVRLHNDR